MVKAETILRLWVLTKPIRKYAAFAAYCYCAMKAVFLIEKSLKSGKQAGFKMYEEVFNKLSLSDEQMAYVAAIMIKLWSTGCEKGNVCMLKFRIWCENKYNCDFRLNDIRKLLTKIEKSPPK